MAPPSFAFCPSQSSSPVVSLPHIALGNTSWLLLSKARACWQNQGSGFGWWAVMKMSEQRLPQPVWLLAALVSVCVLRAESLLAFISPPSPCFSCC